MTPAIETSLKGGTVLWGAPTYDQVRIGWDETQKATGDLYTFNSSRMEATFRPTRGRIIYRSLDKPDNARSHTADLVILDEAAFIHPDAYYLVIRQMLMDTDGSLIATTTPSGLNWFFAEWTAAHDREDSTYWQIPTVGYDIVNGELVRKPHPLENPDIPWSEIVNLFNTLPQRTFKQEIGAEFLTNEGAVFRNVSECTRAEGTTRDKHREHTLVMGVDYAKSDDFTVISVGCVNCRQEVFIDRFNELDYAFQNLRVENAWVHWGCTAGRGDSASIGEANLDHLHKVGIPIIGVPTNSYVHKAKLIEGLSLAMDRIAVQFLPYPVGKAEMEAYEQTKTPTGLPKYGAPSGMHDDVVVARALMYQAMTITPIQAHIAQKNPWSVMKN